MSLPPPPGTAICLASFQKLGTPHLMATTLALSNPSGFNAGNTNTIWRQALSFSSGRPFHASNMIVGWSIVETYVLQTSLLGVPTANSNTTPVVGTRVANGMPVNTSVVVNKTVVPVGRQYRGRMLWPPSWTASTNVDADGIIAGASVTSLQAFATSMFAVFAANGYGVVLLHQPPQGGGPIPAPTAVSSLVVRNRIGTIRHRIRR